MIITPIEDIVLHWHWMAPLLTPAIVGSGRTMEGVKAQLVRREMGAASIHVPNGAGLITLQPGEFDGVFALWVPYIFAQLKAGPKAWMKTMIEVMAYFEDKAREAGCAEIRIGGRDWSFLPGYERFDETLNRLKKVL